MRDISHCQIRLLRDPSAPNRARLAAPRRGPPRPPPALPPRRRGAPDGNTNALKHGYYARSLKPEDAAELREYTFECLDDEKQMLRYFIRLVLELGKETSELEQAISLLKVMSMAATTLARITRTEKYVGSYQGVQHHEGELSESLKEILADMTKNLPKL